MRIMDTMEDFASLLKDARQRLGLDQSALARRVNVGQQAVSRWERNLSRPRRAMAVSVATTLDLPIDVVLAAAGYVGAVADSPEEVAPSVRPLARTLPFHELSSERFEDVCVEIIEHRHPGGHASRFGGPGERQGGIDVLVDGERGATGQAKRCDQFGPKAVEDAIKAVVDPAPINYLYLSRPIASVGARAEIKKHKNWELWDGEDLSRYVRNQMSREEALRFVDAHFPNHRQPFLGISQPGPWFSVEEFYAAATGARLFTHDWSLVGRDTELAQLQADVNSGVDSITLLSGRGGIGKSRLLRSVAEAFEGDGWWVRMLPADSLPDAAAFELVPPQIAGLLIIDDAHDRTDIGQIVARVRSRNPAVRLLIAYRPYGKAALGQQLRRAGVDLLSLPTVPLGDLTQEAATHLAREALGPAHTVHAGRLATLTRDCPLATTIGGYLIQSGTLDPRELEQDDRIREHILLGFRDALVAESAHGERDTRSAVIDAISAVQPLRTGTSDFRAMVESLVGMPYSRISRHLRSLEDSGVLMHRGDSVRIVPDLLGDVVLASACFDKTTGVDTGYISEVFNAATGDALRNAFVNISRVDWQVGHVLTDAATPLWDAVQRDLEKRDITVYLDILALLDRVAPFQPMHVINSLRWILDNPIQDEPLDADSPGFRLTWTHLLEQIPQVLRAASYTLQRFSAACEMLWTLAQTDGRATHRFPNHPLRVLRELFAYAPEKPIDYNLAALELTEAWSAVNSPLSPLLTIEELVATEGYSQIYRDRTLSFRPFAIRQEVARPIRRRAIGLALKEVESGHIQRAVAGGQFAEAALRYPAGNFGRTVGNDERTSWDPDFVETIEALHEALRGDLDPVVCLSIYEALHWHADYGDGAPRAAAESAIEDLPNTVEFDVALLLHDGWAALIRERGMDFTAYESATAARLERVASRALNELDDAALILLLEERLEKERSAFKSDIAGPDRLLGALIERRHTLAHAIIDRLFDNPESELLPVVSILVNHIGRLDPGALMNVVRRFLAHPSPTVGTDAAVGLASRDRSSSPLQDGELELLQTFATDSEVHVRLAVLTAVRALAATNPLTAADLLSHINIGDSRTVADNVFMCLTWGNRAFTWETLNEDQRSALVAVLENLSSIDEHSIMEFLRRLSAEDPKTVLGLLRRRIEAGESMKRLGDFKPIPLVWREPLAIRQHPDFLTSLGELLEWIGQGQSWQREHMGRELFAAAAGRFDQPVLSLLLETVRSGSATDAQTVASVLAAAPSDLVFEHVNFVSDLLAAAARLGRSTAAMMQQHLKASALTGERWGRPGEPYVQDVRIRDDGAAIATRLPHGTLAADFYRSLSEHAARVVEHDSADDEIDGRTW
jgi:transcriptional regulator with XRE-family HTH domain